VPCLVENGNSLASKLRSQLSKSRSDAAKSIQEHGQWYQSPARAEYQEKAPEPFVDTACRASDLTETIEGLYASVFEVTGCSAGQPFQSEYKPLKTPAWCRDIFLDCEQFAQHPQSSLQNILPPDEPLLVSAWVLIRIIIRGQE
jgi:hypothetical protein